MILRKWSHLEISQHSNGVVVLLLNLADEADERLFLVVLTVGKVEAEHVRSRQKQLLDHLKCIARGTKSGDLLGCLLESTRVEIKHRLRIGMEVLWDRCLHRKLSGYC